MSILLLLSIDSMHIECNYHYIKKYYSENSNNPISLFSNSLNSFAPNFSFLNASKYFSNVHVSIIRLLFSLASSI